MALTFITPGTKDDLEHYREPCEYLYSQVEGNPPELFNAWFDTVAGYLTLVYLDSLLVAGFELRLSKRSAELHGVFPQRMNERLPADGRRAVKREVLAAIYEAVFKKSGKAKLIAKVHKANTRARRFMASMGGAPLTHSNGNIQYDNDRLIYTVTKEKADEFWRRK